MKKLDKGNSMVITKIIRGMLVCIATLIILLFLLSVLTVNNIVGEGSAGYLLYFCNFLAFLSGGVTVRAKSKEHWFLPIISIGSIWAIQLFCGILFINSKSINIIGTLITALAAMALVCIRYIKRQTKSSYKKLRVR